MFPHHYQRLSPDCAYLTLLTPQVKRTASSLAAAIATEKLLLVLYLSDGSPLGLWARGGGLHGWAVGFSVALQGQWLTRCLSRYVVEVTFRRLLSRGQIHW